MYLLNQTVLEGGMTFWRAMKRMLGSKKLGTTELNEG